MGLAGLGGPAEHAGIVDDHTASARVHVLQRGSGATHRSVEGHVEDDRPLIVGHFVKFGGATESGVVDENVDRSELARRFVDQRANARLVGHVARDSDHPE